MEFAEFEQRGWARRSGTYDSGFGAMTARLHERLLDEAGVDEAGVCEAGIDESAAAEGTRLLEVGCGTGRLSALALARGANVVATDAVPQMVAEAARVLPGAEVRQALLPGLPFADGEFDAAVGSFVINHVPDPPGAVADLRRVVRPGGRVVLSCWDTLARNRAQGVFFDAFAEAGAARPAGLPAVSPFAAHADEPGLAALLERAGLTGVRVERAEWLHRVDPARWWEDILAGTVLTSSLIEGQDEQSLHRIRAAYDRLAAAYTGGFPVAALVAVGTR